MRRDFSGSSALQCFLCHQVWGGARRYLQDVDEKGRTWPMAGPEAHHLMLVPQKRTLKARIRAISRNPVRMLAAEPIPPRSSGSRRDLDNMSMCVPSVPPS